MWTARLFIVPFVLIAQDYRGSVRPLNTSPHTAAAIEFFKFRFQTLVLGREGPSYFPIKTAPMRGREYFVEADLSGIDAVASIRFEFADEAGRPVLPLNLWKATDSASDGEFHGLAAVPPHPFRVIAMGTDRNGVAFRRALPQLIAPVVSAPEPPLLPPGIEPRYADAVRKMIDESSKDVQARAAQAARETPGGLITIWRAGVLNMTYEPYLASAGALLGLRLNYQIRFAADAVVSIVPNVFPAYPAYAWRGVVTMEPLGGNVAPAPELEGATSLADVIVYGGRARYRAGITYSVWVNMIPDYMIQGVQSGRFCAYEQKFQSRRALWEALRADTNPVKYSLSLYDLDYSAEIPVFYAQRTFYENFVRGGAFDCGAMPSNRF